MSARTLFLQPGDAVAAGSTPKYKGQLKDADGNLVPGSALTSLTLSLVVTGSNPAVFVNSVQNIDILNKDRGAVDAQGNLVVALQSGDTAIQTPGNQNERRSLVVKFGYGNGQIGPHQVDFIVTAMAGG